MNDVTVMSSTKLTANTHNENPHETYISVFYF